MSAWSIFVNGLEGKTIIVEAPGPRPEVCDMSVIWRVCSDRIICLHFPTSEYENQGFQSESKRKNRH